MVYITDVNTDLPNADELQVLRYPLNKIAPQRGRPKARGVTPLTDIHNENVVNTMGQTHTSTLCQVAIRNEKAYLQGHTHLAVDPPTRSGLPTRGG